MSSRIFIKGLPPTLSEADFRRHFSQNIAITDAKVFPNRRIGYVGYKTPEDAQKAVKYFNKSFIRMSKIGVELARPPRDAKENVEGMRRASGPPTARIESNTAKDNAASRRRQSQGEQDPKADPKLKEFLEVMRPKSKKRAWEDGAADAAGADQVHEETAVEAKPDAGKSDDEYEEVPRPSKRFKEDTNLADAIIEEPVAETAPPAEAAAEPGQHVENEDSTEPEAAQPAVSDADWARSRTSRLLGLLDDEEEEEAGNAATRDREESLSEDEAILQKGISKETIAEVFPKSMPTPPMDEMEGEDASDPSLDPDTEAVRSSMRLFLRNLSYNVKSEDLEKLFEPYGHLEEIHVPMDKKTGTVKGFAYVQFSDADAAENAMKENDGQTFEGRLLHILPAQKKRETKLDDFELSKLSLKKQQEIKRKREAASTNFNWNALYMNTNTVVSSVAHRLGLAKSEVLDPTSSDAAIKQAHAETHIIQETKAYFKQHGVDLDAFKKSQRGDTAILVKNITYDTNRDELTRLFEEHGELKKFLMPPSQTIAIVEFANEAQCKAAFGALAYRKLKGSVLFLEKAPKGIFDSKSITDIDRHETGGVSTTSAADLKTADNTVSSTAGSSTLFVRNLNFSTTTKDLSELFQAAEGFLTARVKTKTDPKKPGQLLSMGFGFADFRSAQQAQAALQAMDGYSLQGHKLQIRASHKGADAAEERRMADAEKRAASKKTKVVIKNLPFEATRKDVRALFGAYGQLRSVRVPKKMDRAARGFAFADFTTPKEAESAMDALRDTHLLGRRLVLDFADEEPEDAEAEIEKMQQKVGAQVNKVALQKLTSGGRKKFSTQQDEDDG